MKRTKHKIRELRRLVELCGGSIPLPGNHHGTWAGEVQTGDATHWVKENADHIICYARATLRGRGVDVRWDDYSWRWGGSASLCGWHSGYPTEAAAMIDALEATA